MNPNRAPAPAAAPGETLAVWLAGPDARARFDPEAQSAADLARWRAIAGRQRREDWEVSRALLANAITAGNRAPLANAIAPGSRAPLANAVAPGARYSLGHSGGHAAVATSLAATAVGVDLEHLRERDFLRLSRFAFAPDEHEALAALPAREHALRFYFLWTLKEAVTKALGQPLLSTVRQCTFAESDGCWQANVPTAGAWIARVFQPRPQLVLSVFALYDGIPGTVNSSVSMHEWPCSVTPEWPTLATLSSHAA